MSPFQVGPLTIGAGRLTLIAGPCLAESMGLCEQVAGALQQLAHEFGFGYIFKASYDKANRSSGAGPRGSGLDAGLEIIATIKNRFNVPVTTDYHLPSEAAKAASVADLLQVPAFLCRQTDLLQAGAETGKPINVKKGQFLAPHDCRNIVDKLQSFQAAGIMLTERGASFGYNALIVDMPGLETMRSLGVPVCFDATHSAQRPGSAGTETGGARWSVPAMTRAAIAVGVDALFLEVHPDPENAQSDRETQWPLNRAKELLEQVAAIQSCRPSSSSHE